MHHKADSAAVVTLIALSAVTGPAYAQTIRKFPDAAASRLTITIAEHMAAACIAYAAKRRGAVNIWIYDADGRVVRFQRMSGAPLIGAPPDTPDDSSATPFGSALDPNSLEPSDPGDVPVRVAGAVIGSVRVAGMSPASDHICAEASAAAVAPATPRR